MKMTAMCTDANLTRAYQRGWSVYSNEDIPPPLETNTHRYICMENYQKQNQACKTPPLCTPARGRRQSLQACTSLNGKGTFAKNNLKGNIHSCFYVKWTTINRMFPLSKHHRKPHINKGV